MSLRIVQGIRLEMKKEGFFVLYPQDLRVKTELPQRFVLLFNFSS